MTIKQTIHSLLAVIVCSALYTSIKNTNKWASDFNGLVVLVSISDKERSYNPFSQDFFWVSQDMAVSIIKKMEYPYRRCAPISIRLGGCDQPRIEYVGRFVGIVSIETEQKIFEVIRFLIEREEPIDAYSTEGYTALQSAILGNSPRLVSLLLESGANPYLPIKNKGKMQGKSSVDFVELLSSKDVERFSDLKATFYEQVLNNSKQQGPATRPR
ncbi:MAG: ankyrin repeat domain-containing protein [Cellvibrionaceae bacterium]|nr:ankyrin repeat domain-containing protein [Cellvibrionaceae bacterium]